MDQGKPSPTYPNWWSLPIFFCHTIPCHHYFCSQIIPCPFVIHRPDHFLLSNLKTSNRSQFCLLSLLFSALPLPPLSFLLFLLILAIASFHCCSYGHERYQISSFEQELSNFQEKWYIIKYSLFFKKPTMIFHLKLLHLFMLIRVGIALHTANEGCFVHFCSYNDPHNAHKTIHFAHCVTWRPECRRKSFFCLPFPPPHILHSGQQCNYSNRSSFGVIQCIKVGFMIDEMLQLCYYI